jgi:DNA-directed RNA polymerase II subunit RPB2
MLGNVKIERRKECGRMKSNRKMSNNDIINDRNDRNDINDDDKKEYEKEVMNFLSKYFNEKDVCHHQKSSFNFFIHHRLARIIEEEPMLEVQLPNHEIYRVVFGQVFVDKPYIVDEKRTIRYITPNEARLRDLTYSSVVSVNIQTFRVKKDPLTSHEEIIEQKDLCKLPLARIPIMVLSSKCNLANKSLEERRNLGECEFDYGGYFIIKGKERVLVAQERINYNIVYVFEGKVNTKFPHVAEIRSMSEETGHSILLQMKWHSGENKLYLSLPYLKHDIPLGYIFVALDCEPDQIISLIHVNLPKEYVHHYVVQQWIRNIVKEMEWIGTKEEALEYISHFSSYSIPKDKKIAFVKQIMNNEMLPHLGISSLPSHKVFFLCHMFSKIVLVYAKIKNFDDRDHLSNKRVEVGGILVAELFRTLYKRFMRSLEPQLVKRQDVALVMSRMNVITQGLKHCFATGNWGVPKSSYMRTGVSQVLSRLTYMGTLSHMRRILIPIGKEGKNTKIRQLHPSQLGFFCPSETPEGHSAGIVKNFSLLCEVTCKFETVYLRCILDSLPHIDRKLDWKSLHPLSVIKLFYNGILYGMVKDGEETYHTLIQYKRQNRIHYSTSITYDKDYQEIHLFCDEGRLLRPLFNAKDVPTLEDLKEKTWDELTELGKIVWSDAHEMENRVVSCFPHEIKPYHDTCDIHPSLMMGVCVNLIPYPDHTQSPRLCYVASMSKQALGVYASTHNMRTDTIVHTISYAEQPIIQTHFSEMVGYNDLPCGNNLIVAILCYTGFNQEDSVIFNQSSLERGVFRTYQYKTLVAEEKKKTSHCMETIALVPEEFRNRSNNYSKLNMDGIIKRGVYVGPGDVIVSRMVHRPTRIRREITDTSYVIKNGEEGFIDNVFVSITPDGYKMVKIPEIGDKVCSRCSQKGTIGMVMRHEDMPFTLDGIVPDLIMNPHAIPSRMTMNQLLECIGAKSAVHEGKFRWSTAFTSHSVNILEDLCDELHKNGFQRHGNERMMNGITGEMLDANIFIGPTYYQRLKHLVSGKIHARNHGNVQMLFRQPCEGRSKEGGLRFGEMERDAMISHGTSRFLLERLFDMSDPFKIPVCTNCGMIPHHWKRCQHCSSLGKSHHVDQVPIPYACKLLFQEVMAMGIRISLKFDENSQTKQLVFLK